MSLKVRIAFALAACFVVAGAVVLVVSALTYQNAVYRSPEQQTDEMLHRLGSNRAQALAYLRQHPEAVFGINTPTRTPNGRSVNEAFQQAQRSVQHDAINRARVWSAIALLTMAVVAGLVGWYLAGRALRPLRAIASRAQEASATDLSARVALAGPNDEIRVLGETFNDMLGRLEQAFEAQRRFTAQVSHELRTPLAVIATETDLMLSDVEIDRAALQQIRAATDRAERIIVALLVLSRSGSGDIRPVDLELERVTGDVMGELVFEPGWREVRIEVELDPTPVHADPALLERLVTNLLSNAVRHNRPDGWVDVRTTRDGQWALLEVANSTPLAPTAAAGSDDAATIDRSGIGLTVVQAVVAAHGGTFVWIDEPDTVRVQVRLPLPPAPATPGAPSVTATV
jgi:signal transduction histidine kinase